MSALFASGCTVTSDTGNPGAGANVQSYTDPASGIALPQQAGSLERIALTPDHSGHDVIRAAYLSTDNSSSQPDLDIQNRLNHAGMQFYLNAEVTIAPAVTSPSQVIMLRLAQSRLSPNFIQDNYPTTKTFGNQVANCAQCTFDRPTWNDRATNRIIVLPHGNYLVIISFSGLASKFSGWDTAMDDFVNQFAAQPVK